MKGPVRVKFVPIKDGDIIEETSKMDEALHFVGFKPGPAGKRAGWLVYLIHEGSATGRSWNGQPLIQRIPASTGIYHRRRPAA